ncbi:MAG: hypothetical protein MZW92_43370 [Comamonadaceae bacterium]|nr:hypothetical protein [Comamonadaceae bacterium]
MQFGQRRRLRRLRRRRTRADARRGAAARRLRPARARRSPSSPRPSSTPPARGGCAASTRERGLERRGDDPRPRGAARRRPGGPRRARHRPLPRAGDDGPRRGPDRVPAPASTPSGDKLYVPVAQLHLIGRYSGAAARGGAAAPARQRPVGQGARKRARSRCATPPPNCSNLYAQRAARKGHAFELQAARLRGLRRGLRLRGDARPAGAPSTRCSTT